VLKASPVVDRAAHKAWMKLIVLYMLVSGAHRLSSIQIWWVTSLCESWCPINSVTTVKGAFKTF
jgi:hypothetical protein